MGYRSWLGIWQSEPVSPTSKPEAITLDSWKAERSTCKTYFPCLKLTTLRMTNCFANLDAVAAIIRRSPALREFALEVNLSKYIVNVSDTEAELAGSQHSLMIPQECPSVFRALETHVTTFTALTLGITRSTRGLVKYVSFPQCGFRVLETLRYVRVSEFHIGSCLIVV